MMNQMDPIRAQAILALKFNGKMKIAWQLFKMRALVYFGAIFLILILFGSAIFAFVWLSYQMPVFLILFIPILLLGAFVQIGFHRSILWFMDGQEPNFKFATFFELFMRMKILFVPVIVFGICFLVANVIIELIDMIPLIGWLISLPHSAILNLILGAYNLFWAENEHATTEENLTAPLGLFGENIESWASALLGCALVYIPAFVLIFTLVFAYFIMGHNIEFFNFFIGDPNSYYYGYSNWSTSPSTAGLIGYAISGFIAIILLIGAYIFSTFLYAIAYKQSMAKKQYYVAVAQRLKPQ